MRWEPIVKPPSAAGRFNLTDYQRACAEFSWSRARLDLDSLDFLQCVEILSETSGHRIDEDDYPELATLNSSMRFLAAR